MKIKIFFYDENITWDKSWIFLGSSFKNLKFDPQEVFIDGGTSILLPEEWNNSRLGHNRSIQWVCQNL